MEALCHNYQILNIYFHGYLKGETKKSVQVLTLTASEAKSDTPGTVKSKE